MGKRKGESNVREEEGTKKTKGLKQQRADEASRQRVNSHILSLAYNEECLRQYKEKFEDRDILTTKYINVIELARLHNQQNVNTFNLLDIQGWIDFTKVNGPICKHLLRILMANLNKDTMLSWIGKNKVDLSEEAWCKVFKIPIVTEEEEESIMGIEKEEIFYELSGIQNLGVNNFIKIHDLHQNATMRLSAQVVNTILIPKKGAKERIQFEESRILYALLHKKKINLAKMIVSRLRAALERKSSPITYGMHLMMLMEKAGVNLRCTEEKEEIISAPIGHNTLKWLGFKLKHGKWNFEGRGQSKGKEEKHEGQEEGTQDKSSTPSKHASRNSQSNLHINSQLQSLKTEISHLQAFLVEQMQLMHATLQSKLDSLDSRVQALEEHRILQPTASPHHSPSFTSADPKGKRPLSPSSSFHTPQSSPHPGPSTEPTSPTPEPSKPSSPLLQPSKSPSPLHESLSSPPTSPTHLSHPDSPLGSPKNTPSSSPILIGSTSSNSTSSSTSDDHRAVPVRPISTRLRSSSTTFRKR